MAANEALFSKGLAFLNKRYPEQWAETEQRLQSVDKNALGPTINEAVGGPEYLDELLAAHAEYGRALNITSPKGVEATVNLTDALRVLRAAILGYTLQVVAWSQSGDDAAAACAGALLAIDRERASDAQRQSGKQVPEPDVSPETPVPEV